MDESDGNGSESMSEAIATPKAVQHLDRMVAELAGLLREPTPDLRALTNLIALVEMVHEISSELRMKNEKLRMKGEKKGGRKIERRNGEMGKR